VPTARVAIGHGQMNEKELERVMTGFIHKEFDVFVCTTIIGSGIDIPNANTIVIDRADHFGLAELYQLRGRVGRYKHRAFAYLLIPGDRALSEDAQKRLKALEEFSTLGAGFRIAMRDLEIRGAGSLLGGEQHGHIATVGFDTYTQLVAEAVAEVKGEPARTRRLPLFEIVAEAYIPEEYVTSESQKITLYKRVAGLQSEEDVAEMLAELKDRFGEPPAPVRRLLEVMRVRALGADAGVRRIVGGKNGVTVELGPGRQLDRGKREALSHAFGDRLTFEWKETPSVTCRLDGAPDETAIAAAAQRLLRALAEG